MLDTLRKTVVPVLAAILWGVAFVFQKNITTGPFAFNALRSAVAFMFLLVVSLCLTKGKIKRVLSEDNKSDTKRLWLAGVCCGVALTAATYLQQLGLSGDTEAGKASFLTAMYIVIVPILGIVLKKKAPFTVWISVAIAVLGLYLLCVNNGFTVQLSDVLVLSSALMFSIQIMTVDRYVAKVNAIKLSCIQFLTVSILSFAFALIFEDISITGIRSDILNILYLGIMSSGIAYTLQIVAQKDSNPTVVSLLLSLESVFGVIAGAIFLEEVLSLREYVGCALMFVAVVMAQLPIDKWLQRRKNSAIEQQDTDTENESK